MVSNQEIAIAQMRERIRLKRRLLDLYENLDNGAQ